MEIQNYLNQIISFKITYNLFQWNSTYIYFKVNTKLKVTYQFKKK